MTSRRRVAIFTDNDFEKVNGVTTTLSAVLAHAPDDVAVRVYTASRLGADRPDYLALPSWGVGIPFYSEMRMYWPPYRALVRHLRRDRIDLIHLTTPGPLGLAAVAAARQLGLPLVGSFHTDLASYTTMLSGHRALGAFMRHYMRWLYSQCTRVLVPSNDTRALLAGAGTPPDRISVWGRGVDADAYSPRHRSVWQRAEWRAGQDRPVLLYVGRISEEKGVRQLPRLHDALLRLGIDHRLVVVGDGPLRGDLARMCPDAVLPGTLGKEALATAYASADVFVFPSTTDTAGNVVLEAQASGLPVIVSDRGGPREQMLPGTTGIVCGADDAAWIAAAAGLYIDAARRGAMSRAAREWAAGRAWDVMLGPLFETYRRAPEVGLPQPAPAGRVRRTRQPA
ncbi:MAG: glycosyltransferase family 1 protein [Acidobacteria bacterium]|nr:glycosyltransferase family 1 protein [Acidobacteriota bacterium]